MLLRSGEDFMSVFRLFDFQVQNLEKHYADDRVKLFNANVLSNIFLGCAAIVLVFSVGLKIVFPDLMAPLSKRVFLFFDIGLIITCLFAYGFLQRGYFNIGRGIFTVAAVVSTLSAVMLTGGFPNSVARPTLVLVPVIAYLFYGGRVGLFLAVAVLSVVFAQWYAVAFLGLVLPDYTSLSSPAMNSFIVFVTSFGAVLAIIATYQHRNHLLQQALSTERRNFAELANRDALTGLGNTRYFYDKLERSGELAAKNDGRLAVFYIDLDCFKPINDTYGHEVGDQVLKAVALKIQNCVRKDDLVARIGGDEFAVLMRSMVDDFEIEKVLYRLRKIGYKPLTIDGCDHFVGLSIGHSEFPNDTRDVKQLLINADQLMYRDKQDKDKRANFAPNRKSSGDTVRAA